MKKICILMLLLLLPLNACTALADTTGLDVSVSLINQNPDPARPGETMELTVSVQNTGNKDLKNIVVEIVPEGTSSSLYPFSEVSGEGLEKEVSFLNSRNDDKDSAILKFKLKTDADVPEGTYEVDIKTTAEYEDGSGTKVFSSTETIELDVRGMEYAQILTINRANIDIAKEEPLEFIITNTGNSPLKNLVISWSDPDGVILPVRSDNTKYIKYLEVDESVTVAYSIMADVNAVPGLYTLNINLSFEDYDSEATSMQTTAGLFVGGETDFDVSFSESDAGEISLSVANVGNNEAYSVKVSLPEQEGYRVSGSSSEIVGNLEKGDYTITSFKVLSPQPAGSDSESLSGTAKAADSGSNRALKVRIEYTDAKGERLSVEKEVPVQMTVSTGTDGSTGNYGGRNNPGSSTTSYTSYALIVVVAGAGVFLYRRHKQENKNSGNRNSENKNSENRGV